MLVRKEFTDTRKKLNKIRDYLYKEHSVKGESDRFRRLVDKIYRICRQEGM